MRRASELGLVLAAALLLVVAACVVAGAQKAGAGKLHPELYASVNIPDNVSDVYVVDSTPDTNFGTNPWLYFGSYSSDTSRRRTFIRFDVSSIPDTAVIDSGTLYLYISGLEVGATTYSLHVSNNKSWNENTVTWNNQPSIDARCQKQTISTTGWWAWNVKGAVENALDTDNLSLALRADNESVTNTLIYMYSKEYGTPSVYPYLVVIYWAGPNAPTSPYCENSTNPNRMTMATNTPHFNAIYTDNDAGDNALYIQIQVGSSPGDNSKLDSGWLSITDQFGGKLENNERSADVTYAGSALGSGVTYHWRIRFKDNYGAVGDWSSDQTFSMGHHAVSGVTASATIIDRKIDQVGSSAVDNTIVHILVQDNFGRDWISKCYIWIRDNTDAVVVDNAEVTSYENVDSTTKRFSYPFAVRDNSVQCGYYDFKVLAVDNTGLENMTDYTSSSFGYQLLMVDDYIVTENLDTASPIYQVGVSGSISRVSGVAATVSAVKVVDNNEGSLNPDSFSNTNYSDNFGLVSPTRLYRGSQGSVFTWARGDNLDGKSASRIYTVQGDNATVALGNINNQVGQSVVNFTVKWSDSANVGSGTAYHQDNTSYSTAIANGSGSFTLLHTIWKLTGATVITIDNADRPLWNVSNATFNTDKLAWAENQPLSGTNDNASLTIKITYNDGSTNNTIRAELLAGTVDNGQVTSDTNGLMAWNGIDLPDNSTDVQIRLDNVFDSRTDKVINARNVEDAIIYTSPSVSSFTINSGASSTVSSTVALALSASSIDSNVHQMCFGNDNASWSVWEEYSTSKSWSLGSGDGLKTVYVKVRDLILNESGVLSASITKYTSSPPPASPSPPPSSPLPSPPSSPTTQSDTTTHAPTVPEPGASNIGENVSASAEMAENVANENVGEATVTSENDNVAPMFALHLPTTAISVENGLVPIELYVANQTSRAIVKHWELQLGARVVSFDFEAQPNDNTLIVVWVDVAGMSGMYDVKLIDTGDNTVLSEGQVTLAGAAKIAAPQVSASPITSTLFATVVMSAIGVAVGLVVLRYSSRPSRPSMSRWRLRAGRFNPKERVKNEPKKVSTLPIVTRKVDSVEDESPVLYGYFDLLKPMAEELAENALDEGSSPVITKYHDLLTPAARERAKKNKVKHVGRAAKPYRSEK